MIFEKDPRSAFIKDIFRTRDALVEEKIRNKWRQNKALDHVALPTVFVLNRQVKVDEITRTASDWTVLPLKGGGELRLGRVKQEYGPSILKNLREVDPLALQFYTVNARGTKVAYPPLTWSIGLDTIRSLGQPFQEGQTLELLRQLALFDPRDIDLEQLDITDIPTAELLLFLGIKLEHLEEQSALSVHEWEVESSAGFTSTDWNEEIIKKQRIRSLLKVENFTDITRLFEKEVLLHYFGQDYERMVGLAMVFLSFTINPHGMNLSAYQEIVRYGNDNEVEPELDRELTHTELFAVARFLNDFGLAKVTEVENKFSSTSRTRERLFKEQGERINPDYSIVSHPFIKLLLERFFSQ